ncbi:terminase large subunit domain-containing protein [Rhodococcoides fascians]|uniref:terminase large subunit domain-containing protein n=1 Tax=Rhodococcoides fascians TaxID=1828 RepID=UPI000563E104|nr:terminase large subunit [Rhodococcus fascians]
MIGLSDRKITLPEEYREDWVDEVPPWLPRVYTQPIENPDYSEGDKLIRLSEKVFRFAAGDELRLDTWQKWLIREILQKYPEDYHDQSLAGQLVYKQVVVSMGRQNGKTVLGAVMALYGLVLMVPRAPEVISIAAYVEQAKNLYAKVRYCVDNVPLLTKRFKTTDRNGIKSKNLKKPASYVVKAAGDGDGLQGFSGCLMLLDELHLLKAAAWFALVLGASAQVKALVAGFTTAGDDNSELLKLLYRIGRSAAAKEEGHDPRFGFFLWEADPALELYAPEALIQANPAIASGRLRLEDELRTGRNMLESEYRRYRRNEFVSVENIWMAMPSWLNAAFGPMPKAARSQPLIISFARSRRSWDYVSIVASTKYNDVVYTQLIATITFGNDDLLLKKLVALAKKVRVEKFVTDAETMKPTVLALDAKHYKAEYLTRANIANATVTAHSMFKDGRARHAGQKGLQDQLTKTVAVNAGNGVVISLDKSLGDIDAIYATVMGVFMAEQQQPFTLPIRRF